MTFCLKTSVTPPEDQNFIKNGPTTAVYVAVGQNGRVKITGNEDDVWYAIKSGLEELPVFFSYQKQV